MEALGCKVNGKWDTHCPPSPPSFFLGGGGNYEALGCNVNGKWDTHCPPSPPSFFFWGVTMKLLDAMSMGNGILTAPLPLPHSFFGG